jgi:DNA-binding MarR family transcriptional regulator
LGNHTLFAQNFLLLSISNMMGIEKDIQQAKFRNPHQKAAINIIYTLSWMRDKTKCIFESEGITPQQFNILRILRGSFPEPLSTLQIRERMLEKMSDTSRIVDRLMAKRPVKKINRKKRPPPGRCSYHRQGEKNAGAAGCPPG